MDHSEVKHFPKVDHTPAEMDAPAKLLLAAASLIEERGWVQNDCQRGGSFCIQGAIKVVAYGDVDACWLQRDDAGKAYDRVRNAVGSVIAWNDASGRTKAEVVAKLRAVALGIA